MCRRLGELEEVLRRRAEVAALCELALKAELSLDAFFERWPSGATDDVFLEQVFEDLEEGVEHAPFHFFSATLNERAWRESIEYVRLRVDIALLREPDPSSRLLECRTRVLRRKGLHLCDIEYEVARAMKV